MHKYAKYKDKDKVVITAAQWHKGEKLPFLNAPLSKDSERHLQDGTWILRMPKGNLILKSSKDFIKECKPVAS